jgi:argininosuccinate lyase
LKDIFSLITPEKCVEMRKITGGPAAEAVEVQLEALTNFVKDNAPSSKKSDSDDWDKIFENFS